MYFEKLYENFDFLIMDYLNNHNFNQVGRSRDIGYKTYQQSLSQTMASYVICENITPFLKHFLKADDHSISFLNEVLNLLDNTFVKYSDTESQLVKTVNQKSFHIFKSNNKSINIIFSKYRLGIELSKKGVRFFETLDCIKAKHAPILNDDVNPSIVGAINNFNKSLAKLAHISTKSFDAVFFEKIRTMTLADIINLNNSFDDFTYLDENSVIELLVYDKQKQDDSYCAMISSDCIYIVFRRSNTFLKSLKPMFSSNVYSNLLKSFNFYHNYYSIFNKMHVDSLNFSCNHKFLPINHDGVLDIGFGEDFTIAVIPPHDKNVNSSPSLFKVTCNNELHPSGVHMFYSNDLVELYDYIFEFYAPILSKMLDKPVTAMEWRDITLLRMINI
jgi:hypothetical protein